MMTMQVTMTGTVMMNSRRWRRRIPQRLLRVVPTGVDSVGDGRERIHGHQPGERDGCTEEAILHEVLPTVIDQQATQKFHGYSLNWGASQRLKPAPPIHCRPLCGGHVGDSESDPVRQGLVPVLEV